MFSNLQRTIPTFHTEAVTTDYLIRGRFQPLGGVVAFLNDRSRRFTSFLETELLPLQVDRQMGAIKREEMTLHKNRFILLSFLEEGEVSEIQIMPSYRPVIFYLDHVAVHGDLHVNADAKDNDLLDELKDFYPLTNSSIFPIHPLAAKPTRQVPLCFVNMRYIYAYHVHTG
jgi:hypothetical protein